MTNFDPPRTGTGMSEAAVMLVRIAIVIGGVIALIFLGATAVGFITAVTEGGNTSATDIAIIGGILLAIGLLTRPAAFAATIVLLVTVYFHWVQFDQGFSGAEKSLLWTAMTFFFVIRGGNSQSVDARLKKTF